MHKKATHTQNLTFNFTDWSNTRSIPKSGRNEKGNLIIVKRSDIEECATEYQVTLLFSITSDGHEISVRLESHPATVVRIDYGAVDMFDLVKGFPVELVSLDGAKLVPYGDLALEGDSDREVCPLPGGAFWLKMPEGREHPALHDRLFTLESEWEVGFHS